MIEIIPAIDIIDGKCVRLTQGDYDQKKVYNEDPVEVAKMFESHGIRRLHTVDLDGARSQHIVNYKTIERIADHTSLVIDFGGGIKTDEDIDIAFASGATMVTIGSVAVKKPELFESWLMKYNDNKIILGADVKNGLISINGWKEEGDDRLMPFLKKYISKGVDNVLCTDISKDGMLQGPAIQMYKDIMAEFPELHLIASGGVSCIEDIEALEAAGIPAVVFGKAIYEGKINMKDLEKYVG
ncbi:MAG: 1-(5-phosphoribosyl)-5-[(5-phosphoribosylamino)methylideneamino]imidazole-4-carboxamide isomerase [Prevotellaceae bacterium]|nr:1-(5-phosphoribosyl)-5-[(5-phosphoribosylamino)methylideneamino]imidazole-4-carboxamide isomerase [Candidatus Minthosoma caballi]